jgi:hypothetical protein
MSGSKQSMVQMELPAEGGCRCGQLRFRITQPPLATSVCHCTGCQKMSGSAFSTTVIVPGDGFEVIAGKSVMGGLRGAEINHHHCPDCMSWVFTRVAGMDQFVNTRATMLDDPSWFVPFIETYTSEKLPWVTTPAVYSFEKFPEMESYAGLVAEYAAALGSEE